MKNNLSFFLPAVCFMLLSHYSHAQSKAPAIPDAIKTQPNEKQVLSVNAVGVQIYRCDSIAPGEYKWVNDRPEAVLYDKKGNKIGLHYKSPGGVTWELLADHSKVIGKKISGSPSPNTIDWLLVGVKESVNVEKSIFKNVVELQRVLTVGGLPPAKAEKSDVGTEYHSLYEATYYFYANKY